MGKQEIFDATKSLLWDIGYEAMSPRTVMDASGSGQGSLYHHFKSKKDLANAVLSDVATQLKEDADSIFKSAASPLTQILTYLTVERAPLKGCRVGRLAFENSVVADSDLRAHLEDYFKHIQMLVEQALENAIRSGELPDDLKVQEIAALVMSSIQGGYLISRATQNAEFMSLSTGAMTEFLQRIRRKQG